MIIIYTKHYNMKYSIYTNIFYSIKSHELLPNKIQYNTRLMHTNKLRHYYLCLPQSLEVRPKSQEPQFSEEARHMHGVSIVALDSGVHTFQICYNPSGQIIE